MNEHATERGCIDEGLFLEGRWAAANIHKNHAQLDLDRNPS